MSAAERIRYSALVAGCFLLAIAAGWTPIADRINNYVYDWMLILHPANPAAPRSIILAIDEASLNDGGVGQIRAILADGLRIIAPAHPKAVGVDVTLSDAPNSPLNPDLAAALAAMPNVVLAADLVGSPPRWEEPLPLFAGVAKAVGHVHASPDKNDGISREISLEKAVGSKRHWALAFEVFRLFSGGAPVLESSDDVQIAGMTIPARRGNYLDPDLGRPMPILYLAPFQGESRIPRVSVAQLKADPSLAKRFAGKGVFAGVTAVSAARDRMMTNYGWMTGVEVHAHVFETLAGGRFLTHASLAAVVGVSLLLAVAAGLVFAFLAGYPAYALGAVILAAAHLLPHLTFKAGLIMPYFAPVATAWLAVSGAASYQHFFIRRQLRKSESDKSRYQQAIHFVTHEMRTPLTAIQGSSELIGRYNLNDEKRKQIAQVINSESKRLARMVQTFLDVERLSDGHMELRRERLDVAGIVHACVDRARPLAEGKNISLNIERELMGVVEGDRELMEYAAYNLLTNAIKYSPANTVVTIFTATQGGTLRLSVKDQGIGMDDREIRKIFQKFYRTKRAEASGEAGTGIGLSIVDQIVHHHGGKMEVASSPGKGSCFTMILPAAPLNAGAGPKG